MSLCFILFSFSVLLFVQSEASLLEVGKVCVPTAMVQGPCHDCVCTSEGVFHCQRRQCYAVDLNQRRMKEDCQPKHVYRENTTFCICSDAGHWRSDNCQESFRFLHPKTTRMHYELRTNVICEPGFFYVIDCNICRCEANGFIDVSECTNRYCSSSHKADTCDSGDVLRMENELCACSDIHYYIDRLCIAVKSRPVQQINAQQLSTLIDVGKSWRRVTELLQSVCNTNFVYTVDCNKCVCHDGVLVCTTNICHLRRKIALRHEKKVDKTKSVFDSLPELQSLEDQCNPGKNYRYKCNTCQCTRSGHLTCGTMICLADYVLDEKDLRGALSTNVTINHSELPEIREGEACIDGVVYKMECNTCACKDGLLMCTKIACASYPPHKYTGRQKIDKEKKAFKRERKPSKKVFKVSDKEFLKLPALAHHAAYCEPLKKYKVDCNVCVCNKRKVLVCDNKMCVDQKSTRRIEAVKESGKPCKQAYESSRCLKCLCIKGKSKCEAKSIEKCQSEDENLLLAQSSESSRLTFDYKKQECVPDVVYKEVCNKCYCQPDKSLRCTRKMCLNYAQAMQLEAQREYLVAHGL